MILHTFSEFITNSTHTFRELLPEENTFSEFISNITDTFRELFPNITLCFSKHQTVLTFPESYWQTILYTFPELTSNNTDIFKELLANNTTHFSKVHINNNLKSFHQTILTFSESCWQTILQTFPDFISLSNNTDIFGELLPNNTDLFRAHIKQYSHCHRVIIKKL